MRGLVLMTVLVAASTGCGGTTTTSAIVDPGFATTWATIGNMTGPAFSATNGGIVKTFSGPLLVTISDTDLSIAGICPDGSGKAVVSADGDSAAGDGRVDCPAAPVGTCASVSVSYSMITATLKGHSLQVIAAGTGTGCEVSATPVAVIFDSQ